MKLWPSQTNFLRFFAADRFIWTSGKFLFARGKGRDDPRIKVSSPVSLFIFSNDFPLIPEHVAKCEVEVKMVDDVLFLNCT